MNNKTTLIALAILSSIFLTIPALAVTTINVQPVTQEILVGDKFVVYLNVTPGTNISGIQSNIIFNPSVIKIDSITEGNLFKRLNQPTFFNKGITNNVTGTVTNIYDLYLIPTSTITSGTFVEVHGTVITKGSSPITLSNIIIAKPDSTADSISFTNGTIVVIFPFWDVNEDGITNILDLMIVASHFGESTVGRWDVNGDGVTNILDLVKVTQNMTP